MVSYTIEVAEDEVGIVVLGQDGYRFFGTDSRVRSLEGHDFPSAAAATRAASDLIRSGRRPIEPRRRPGSYLTSSAA
ncbi:hypothetical protein [Enterovirga rhinocerotis]|uniref:Uncharacterized protein n=1 Tax=Enterovirga rhinocerotis TaxID=1339210 RepID=A0A4R7BW92_9HYPH|nr:hypothetical protein [Enterovirga rhinocerotis]TDR90124.1 hypothetical protein EV668_2966 [Enterovirga rhinocerotis]